MMIDKTVSTKSFGGWHKQCTHVSKTLGCTMRFAVYLPPQAQSQKVPVLYWLSGLTCTDENFMQKAGALKVASELGIAIVAPDTSPRGEGVPDDPEGGYDLGLGAGFYVNATQPPWKRHYRMFDYVVHELPSIIEATFSVSDRRALSGHSMGGHGALVLALKSPGRYTSASAFSPICNPSMGPWGKKAFSAYLGDSPEDRERWADYDAVELLRNGEYVRVPMLVDQGSADGFLARELSPDVLTSVAEAAGYPLEMRMQEGYDHGYYFVSTFIEDHLRFHAGYLGSTSA